MAIAFVDHEPFPIFQMTIKSIDMQRLTFLIIAILFAAISQAQIEHLTFMGIPIDGKFKDFQKELKSKGFSRTSERSKGIRFYKGSFSGHKCKLLVSFNTNTDVVYSVSVCIPCGFKNYSELTYQNFKKELIKKYETEKFDIYRDYYIGHEELFKEDVETEKLTRINSSSSKNDINGRESTIINITKPILPELSDGLIPSFGYVYLLCEANIGIINVSSEYRYDLESDYRDFVMIIYLDSQNYEPIKKAKEADL